METDLDFKLTVHSFMAPSLMKISAKHAMEGYALLAFVSRTESTQLSGPRAFAVTGLKFAFLGVFNLTRKHGAVIWCEHRCGISSGTMNLPAPARLSVAVDGARQLDYVPACQDSCGQFQKGGLLDRTRNGVHGPVFAGCRMDTPYDGSEYQQTLVLCTTTLFLSYYVSKS